MLTPEQIRKNILARQIREAVLELLNGSVEDAKTEADKKHAVELIAAVEIWCKEWREKNKAPRKGKPPKPLPMDDDEARRFGREPCPYGEFRGHPADDVPMERLDWYADQRWTDDLRRYLASKRIKNEKRVEDEEGWDE